MVTAIYHGEPQRELVVLKENEDGTVDLGKDGVLQIGRCKTDDNGKPGTCTLTDESGLTNDERTARAEKRASRSKTVVRTPSPANDKTHNK